MDAGRKKVKFTKTILVQSVDWVKMGYFDIVAGGMSCAIYSFHINRANDLISKL